MRRPSENFVESEEFPVLAFLEGPLAANAEHRQLNFKPLSVEPQQE